MKYDPIPFDPPATDMVGVFSAQLSPDGWIGSQYINTPYKRLKSEEVNECSRFINSFMAECKTQSDFQKYVGKHGEEIDRVTSVIFYRGDGLDYVVSVSGYSITIKVHRKGK